MKVYLSKSNKSNPDIKWLVQETLKKSNHEIIEYRGGRYSAETLIGPCEALVVVSHPDGYYPSGQVRLGRGILSEVDYALEHNKNVFASNKEGTALYQINKTKARRKVEVQNDSESWMFYSGEITLENVNKAGFNLAIINHEVYPIDESGGKQDSPDDTPML